MPSPSQIAPKASTPLPIHSSPSPPPTEEHTSPLRSPSPAPPQIDPVEAKKIAKMEAKISALEKQIEEMEEKKREVDARLKTSDPQATVKAHIKLLHEYNEIRDIGQGLMGIIADNRGVRVSEVYKDFDVGEGD